MSSLRGADPQRVQAEPHDRYRRGWLRTRPDLEVLYSCSDPGQNTRLREPRSFLKRPGSANIPIQAIGLSLYENIRDGPVEEPGTKVTRTQWLDLSSLEMANLVGKNILIVDEVDDTRTTLEYAVKELQKDVETAREKLGREGEKTTFFVFVLHVRLLQREVRMEADANCKYRTRISRRRDIYRRI